MKAEILSRPAQASVLLVAGLSLFGALLAGLYGEKLGGPLAGESDSYASGPLGQRALVELLRAQGLRVDRLRASDPGDPALPLLFLAPDLQAQTPRGTLRLAEVLESRIEDRLPTLLALPKWDLEKTPGGIIGRPKPGQELESFLSDALPAGGPRPRLSPRPPPWTPGAPLPGRGALDGIVLSLADPRTLSLPEGAGQVVLGTREHALVVRLPDAHGRFLLVADPDLFHNYNIHQGENGAVLPLLAREQLGATRLLVDEVFHGHARQATLWTALGEPPQVLIVLHGLLVGLLALGMGRCRFGPPPALQPRRGRGPGEVLAVTATLLAHGQPAVRLAARWLDELMADLAGRLRIEETRSSAELARRLDEVAVRRGLAALFARLRERLQGERMMPEGEALELAAAALRRHGELAPRTGGAGQAGKGGVAGVRTREAS